MFVPSRIRGPVGSYLTADLALNVGRVLATDYDRVVVGRDPRPSCRLLADAVSAGVREAGGEAVRVGEVPSPTVSHAVVWEGADAGVAVTGSHNPPGDAGLKLFEADGKRYSWTRQRRIVKRVNRGAASLASWDDVGSERRVDDAADRHVEWLLDQFGSLDALDVVVDVGNGTGGVTTDAFAELARSADSLYADPDGTFPGRGSDPTEAACARLGDVVARSDADLGVAHDADADRLAAVDETGTFVQGDALVALFAREAAAGGGRVAVPIDASRRIDEVVEAVGGSVVRTDVGDSAVSKHATASDVVYAGEPSGTHIWPEASLCPDASYAALELGRFVRDRGPLSSLVADLDMYPLRRTAVSVDDRAETMAGVTTRAKARYDDVVTDDGVYVDFGDAWFLVRGSRTERVVRVSAEAPTEDRLARVFERARALVPTGTEAADDALATT